MTTRVLVIDDEEDGLARICDRVARGMAEHPTELPDPYVYPLNAGGLNPAQLLQAVDELTTEDWEAVLVDVTLTDHESDDVEALLLPVQIVQAIRASNKTAIICIYSGIIQDYLRNLYNAELKRADKRPVEQTLRTIIEADVAEFLARTEAPGVIVNRLLTPRWALRLKRQVLQTPEAEIIASVIPTHARGGFGSVIKLSAFGQSLRQGGALGDALLELVAENGIAALIDVHKVAPARNAPVLCITAECNDLDFLAPEIELLREAAPKLNPVVLRPQDSFPDVLSWLIMTAVEAPVIILLLHGGDGYLKGADPHTANAADAQRWMNKPDDFALFRDKVVYCFSCNSLTLADAAVAAGAIAFIGFPDIPFYRFDDELPRREPELTDALQKLFGTLTRLVLLRWFTGQDSIEELVQFIRITVRSLTQQFTREQPDHLYRSEVVAMFGIIEQGVDFRGDGSWKFPGA